jgi:hypothetical protein
LLAVLLLVLPSTAAHAQTFPKPLPEFSPADRIVPEPLTPEEMMKFEALASIEADIRRQSALNPESYFDTGNDKLVQLYKDAAKSPRLMRHVLAYHLSEYARLRDKAQSAMQVSQVADEATIKMLAILSAQNVVLLEALRDSPARQRYEYKFEHAPTEKRANELAADGWELIAVESAGAGRIVPTYVFKREVAK